MSGVKRGFSFKARKGELAPEAFKSLPKPEEEPVNVKPSKMTNGVKAMFSTVKAVPRAVAKPKPVAPASKVVVIERQVPILQPEPEAEPEAEAEPEPQLQPEPESGPIEAADLASILSQGEAPAEVDNLSALGPLREMADLIQAEESKDLYNTGIPQAYVPDTRRGFADFIKQTYTPFELPEVPVDIPVGEKYYPYQKFVRDYMRQSSPYRGILVYHGLGSGKTCTSIATAEALYASAKKKIIVMTPFSLRKNYLNEISFCGFRHFQLKNFWVKLDPADPTTTLFANQILGLSGKYLKAAKAVWAPDFRKTAAESNYDTLSDEDRIEIRKQIISILDWHPEKNPTGRIRFINYNGISAKKLQAIACGEDRFFDNAVIVVDEIHNLIRLMQGTIDPYLIKLKGFKRLVAPEDVTVDRWKPSLCAQGSRFYARGYLFYRLLMDARNSKIVGLSGTPLINFPEELGILANVLHGYVPIVEGLVEQVGATAQEKIRAVGLKHPFTDFVGVKQDPTGGTRVTLTLLPFGVRKLDTSVGVERIPPEEESPDPEKVIASIKETFATAGVPFRGDVAVKASPLLPPFGDAFGSAFIQGDGSGLRNKIVLVTRLTGLVSFYKGSRLDLMPRIKVDEVVRVPFSLLAQRAYSLKRGEEAAREMKPGQASTGFDGTWAQVYEVSEKSASSNYKMGSRQACNFAFPSEVVRPQATRQEALVEADAGVMRDELLTLAPDTVAALEAYDEGSAIALGDEEEEAEEALEEEEREEEVQAEEAQAEETQAAQEAPGQKGGDPTGSLDLSDLLDETAVINPASKTVETLEAVAEAAAAATPARAPAVAEEPSFSAVAVNPASLKPGGKTLKKIRESLLADCKAGRKPGEKYTDACARAKQCLKVLVKDRLKLGVPEGLDTCSPKFAEMLRRIGSSAGSSLVYSQFLEMEGIGIFRICMEVNGFNAIEIVKTAAGLAFSKATELSIRRGPEQLRYISFTGGEEEDVRRMALNIFNAKFSELPESMTRILSESGFTDNQRGQLCRVFCITSAGAEGLSLKNVRAVHIMEPYWNEVRLKQVKGRAIRIGSHLELAEDERDVSIYTYVSVFGEAAQLAKDGDMRIDETIRNVDRVERKDAIKLGLPIPPTATEYILTSDERLYVISQRKKGIIDALESAMKSAAIDCELNYKQNKDGTFKCLPLKGAVGDFLYTPDLDEDIREAAKFTFNEAPVAKITIQKYKGEMYRMREQLGEDGSVIGFDMFNKDDTGLIKRLGTAGAKAGKPAPPVVFLNE